MSRWILGFAVVSLGGCTNRSDGTDEAGAGSSGGVVSTTGDPATAETRADDDSGTDGGVTTASPGSTSTNTNPTTGSGETGRDETTGSADESTSTGANPTTGDSPVCQEHLDIVLTDAYAQPLDPAWIPGSSIAVGATLDNTGGIDVFSYPGLVVESDHPGVTTRAPGNHLFGLPAGEQATLQVVFEADASVMPGTEVEFTLYADALNQECTTLDTTTVTAIVVAG
ncbi:MAG: hypothetical protein AAF799_00040 [Myxococcota bacterium]